MAGLDSAVMGPTARTSHSDDDGNSFTTGLKPLATSSPSAQTTQAQGPLSFVDTVVQQSPTLPPRPPQTIQKRVSPVTGEERVTLTPIEHWEDLSCIRVLDRLHDDGEMDDRGYQTLYRMCQIIWAVGHEIAIRKEVKLPRAQRLTKLQHYFDCLLQGAKVWQKKLKARIRHIWDVAGTLPHPYACDAFQDIWPLLDMIYQALQGLHRRTLDVFRLFGRIFQHYQSNYKVLYALHREKRDYGLCNVLPTADKAYKILRKLPNYAVDADDMIWKIECIYKNTGKRSLKDRARQEKEVKEFDSMTESDKLRGFKEYMREHQQNFIDRVNDPNMDRMSQREFNECLEVFRQDFLECVAVLIKRNEFHVDEFDVAQNETARVVDIGRQPQYAAEVKKGWMVALGLDTAALSRDDDQDVGDARTDSGISAEFAILEEVDIPPWSDGSRLAHLLRQEEPKPQSWQLEGVIDWRLHEKTLDWEVSPPTAKGLRTDKQPVTVSGLGPINADLQQSHIPSTERLEGLEISRQQAIDDAQQTTYDSQASISKAEPQQSNVSQGTNKARPHHRCLPSFHFHAPEMQQGRVHTQSQSEGSLATPMVPIHVSKSFAAIEDDLASRRHERSSTVPDGNYVAGDAGEADSQRPATFVHGRAAGKHRHGVYVPRIFTGSFSQLETEIRRMQLHNVRTPEDQPDLSQSEDFTARDFAVKPQRSPSPTPSPATLLFRREALLSRDTQVQNRVINGEMIRSRRPSTKIRAQTVDDATGGLEAWLAQEGGRGDSPTLASSPLPRPEKKHTH